MKPSPDCCKVAIPPTPIYNRPGLEKIDYRAGTYETFRRAMIESIARKPALAEWTARQSGDYGIALVKMWAYISDILTFYQERIANEAYLRTAVHEDTVRRLARRLDYRPAPGAAAEALLAFTLEDNTSIRIPAELRVQSVPGSDEQPQKFETVESIEASDTLNSAPIVPVPLRANLFAKGTTRATLAGGRAAALMEAVSEGDRMIIFDEDTGQLEEKRVEEFYEQRDGRIEVEWAPAIQVTQTNSRAFTFNQTFRIFGYNAPAQAVHVSSDESSPNGVRTTITPIEDTSFTYEPTGSEQRASILLDSTYDGVKSGDQLLIDAGETGGLALVTVVQVDEQPIAQLSAADTIVGDLARALTGQGAVTKLEVKGLSRTISGDRQAALVYKLSPPELRFWLTPRARQQREDERLTVENLTTTINPLFDLGEPILESPLDAMIEQGGGSETSGQEDVTLSEMQTIMKFVEAGDIDFNRGWELSVGDWIETLRETPSSGWKVPETVSGRILCMPTDTSIPADRLAGRKVFVIGKDQLTNESVVEPAVIAEARERSFGSAAYLQLTLEETLIHEFQTAGARLFGNVAKATHGETITDEVIGSGSAQQAFQSFALAKSPVTFTRAPEAIHGAENTLELRVDGIQWEETERLYGHSAQDRIYTTKVDEEGAMHVQFGNGKMGTRPATGTRNITARYRQGLGERGNVEARTLKTLLDRPKGLNEVTNPRPASGGADRESREETRENAPNTVRTFNRIVSLRDFEDAARAYVGMAKARAEWRWDGLQRTVHLTVAPDKGRELSTSVQENLHAYLDVRRDPHRGLQINAYTKIPLTVQVTLQVREDYQDQKVQEAAAAAVHASFSFDDRSLGQDVHKSDLYHLLQDVTGVVAVRIDELSAPGKALNTAGRLPIFANELATVNTQSLRIRPATLEDE